MELERELEWNIKNEQLVKGTVTGVSQRELESKMLLVEHLIATEKRNLVSVTNQSWNLSESVKKTKYLSIMLW